MLSKFMPYVTIKNILDASFTKVQQKAIITSWKKRTTRFTFGGRGKPVAKDIDKYLTTRVTLKYALNEIEENIKASKAACLQYDWMQRFQRSVFWDQLQAEDNNEIQRTQDLQLHINTLNTLLHDEKKNNPRVSELSILPQLSLIPLRNEVLGGPSP